MSSRELDARQPRCVRSTNHYCYLEVLRPAIRIIASSSHETVVYWLRNLILPMCMTRRRVERIRGRIRGRIRHTRIIVLSDFAIFRRNLAFSGNRVARSVIRRNPSKLRSCRDAGTRRVRGATIEMKLENRHHLSARSFVAGKRLQATIVKPDASWTGPAVGGMDLAMKLVWPTEKCTPGFRETTSRTCSSSSSSAELGVR